MVNYTFINKSYTQKSHKTIGIHGKEIKYITIANKCN